MTFLSSPSPTDSAPAKMTLDRIVRKLFPSTSLLTFNPIFRGMLNAADILPRAAISEFRKLPPNHFRVRVGVGNRILNNQAHFLVHAGDFWLFAFSEGLINMHSNILDIGVGCGRWAHWMRDYNFRGRRFDGTYVGIDIDGEAIEWMKENYDAERFRFHHSTDSSASYNQATNSRDAYRIPEANDTFNLVFSNSLLSHLLEQELENYVGETYRLLKPGGAMMHSHFNIDYPPATYGSRHTFQHSMGNARVESLSQPEAAVAYHEKFLLEVCRRVGFSHSEIIHMPGGAQHQPILFGRK